MYITYILLIYPSFSNILNLYYYMKFKFIYFPNRFRKNNKK